jgi:hypothetical protein
MQQINTIKLKPVSFKKYIPNFFLEKKASSKNVKGTYPLCKSPECNDFTNFTK